MKTLGKSLILGAMLLAGVSQAQTVRINGLVELSGTGATSGTNFDNGIKLAVKEINAAGGILGRKVDYVSYDTQSQPGVAKALAQKAVDENAYVVMGPVFTGSIMVSMAETRRAEIPNFTGGEGASITQQGNPYIFRTSFTQATAMPKIANYIRDAVKAKSVDVIYVNNDFGKGGLDLIKKELESGGAMCNTVIGFGFAQADQLMEASGLLKFLDGTASKVTSGAIGFVNDKLNPFSDIKDPLKDLRENIESKISKLMGNFTEKTFCNGGFWEWPGSMAYWRPAKGNMSDWQQTYGLIWDPKFEDKEARIVEMADGKPAGAGFKAPDDVADFYFSQAEFYLDCKGRWEDADCNNNLPNVDFSMFQMRWRARLIRVHPINVGAALLQPIIDFAVGTAVDKFIKGPITDAIGNRLEKTAVWKKVIGKRIEGGAGEKISKFLLKRVSREAEKSIDKNKSSLKKKYLTPDVKWDPFGDEVYH